MIDPREIKLQLNIKERVTARRSTWIRWGTYVSHQSEFRVLIKNLPVYVCVCVCVCVCARVLGVPLFSPLVVLLTLNHLINFNTFCELIHPSLWSRRLTHTHTHADTHKHTHTHTWYAHYFGRGDAHAFTTPEHTWSLTHPHFVGNSLHACRGHTLLHIFNKLPMLERLIDR